MPDPIELVSKLLHIFLGKKKHGIQFWVFFHMALHLVNLYKQSFLLFFMDTVQSFTMSQTRGKLDLVQVLPDYKRCSKNCSMDHISTTPWVCSQSVFASHSP